MFCFVPPMTLQNVSLSTLLVLVFIGVSCKLGIVFVGTWKYYLIKNGWRTNEDQLYDLEHYTPIPIPKSIIICWIKIKGQTFYYSNTTTFFYHSRRSLFNTFTSSGICSQFSSSWWRKWGPLTNCSISNCHQDVDLRFSWDKISGMLSGSRTTLWRRVRGNESFRDYYTDIINDNLDQIIHALRQNFPKLGYQYDAGAKEVKLFMFNVNVYVKV